MPLATCLGPLPRHRTRPAGADTAATIFT